MLQLNNLMLNLRVITKFHHHFMGREGHQIPYTHHGEITEINFKGSEN